VSKEAVMADVAVRPHETGAGEYTYQPGFVN